MLTVPHCRGTNVTLERLVFTGCVDGSALAVRAAINESDRGYTPRRAKDFWEEANRRKWSGVHQMLCSSYSEWTWLFV